MGSGISGAAVLRMATALVTVLGGDQIGLVLPATATAPDLGGQLGLADPGTQIVTIKPVVTRPLEAGNAAPRKRYEFTLPASALTAQLSQLGFGSADELLGGALGVMYEDKMLHIESVTPESLAGTQYIFLVVAVE